MPKEKVLLKFSLRKKTIYDDLADLLPKDLEFFHLPPRYAVLNHDLCDACGDNGMFVCCDSCPKSFHFSCTNPPVHPECIPEDDWYCGECRTFEKDPEIHKFGYKIAIGLLPSIDSKKNDIHLVNNSMEDQSHSSSEFLPFEPLFANKNVQIFSLSEFQLAKTEETNEVIASARFSQHPLCHRCGLTEIHGPIAKCSECPLAWHFDCVDPPICSLPSISHSDWLCPIHIDHFVELPPKRHRKSLTPRRALSAWEWNDGNVDIVIESPYAQSSGLLSDVAVRLRLASKLNKLRNLEPTSSLE